MRITRSTVFLRPCAQTTAKQVHLWGSRTEQLGLRVRHNQTYRVFRCGTSKRSSRSRSQVSIIAWVPLRDAMFRYGSIVGECIQDVNPGDYGYCLLQFPSRATRPGELRGYRPLGAVKTPRIPHQGTGSCSPAVFSSTLAIRPMRALHCLPILPTVIPVGQPWIARRRV